MNRQIRFTALLLAVCLLLNSVAFPAAAEGGLEPTQETTEVTIAPTEEVTDPTQGTTAPTEEATDPTEETTEPLPQIQLEGNTLEITSVRELVMLSYVDPQEYDDLSLTFSPSDEENAGFDLTTALDGLQFQGLGSEEFPFQGEILFAEQTGPIALNRPLFNALSDDAKITGLSLESHVQGVAEGGLLAKTVTHGQGGNTWVVTLTQPDATAECNLIPLISNLENGTDVSVNLTDLSGLSVLGSGYLCAVMGENAQLILSGVDTIPAVTGSGDAVGGLVGLMKSGASLTVMGESITVSGVTGNWNVGGIVGSATDPLLSLPPVIGCDGAVVSGVNVGGLIGRLTYMPGDHTLSVTLSNLTLEGSDNAGGLVGVLLRDAGTLTLDAQVEGIVLTEGAINCGSLFGTYYTSSPENPLILNGEPIAEEAELEALAGLVDYPGKLEIFVTVEDAQAIIDSILNAELRPGEMSPLWWAVVSGKLTAEELAAQLNAYYSGATETDPAEETEPTEESEATEPTEETQTQETDNLPQEPTPGEGDSSPETASFSLQAEDSSTVSFAEESTEPAFALLESLVSSYATTMLPWPAEITQYEIKKVEDLVLLSYVEPSTYKKGEVTVKVNQGSIFDLTKSYDVISEGTTISGLSFQGLGDEANPFSGSFKLDASCSNLVIKLNRPLFKALSDTAELSTLTLRSSITTEPETNIPAALLAEEVYHANVSETTQTEGEQTPQSSTNAWSINLQGIVNGYSLPLIGTMTPNSNVKVTVSLSVGTVKNDENGNVVDSSYSGTGSASDLTVLGGGYLCVTMESDTTLTVTGITTVPTVKNASGNAGGLVGTMGKSAILNVTDTTSLTLSAVTATSGNAGGLVGFMESDTALNAANLTDLTLSAVSATNGNAGGLVGNLDASATINTDAVNITLADITATGSGTNGNAGGLVGYAENPNLSHLPAISNTTSITISGRSAGGLVGWLQNSADNSFELKKNISNITLSGTDSSGGLFGELHNDKANADAAAIRYTLSAPAAVTKDAEGNITTTSPQISNISLEGGSAGGLIGKYYTDDLANTLTITDVSVISSSSATNYGGVIGMVDGDAAYVAFSNVATNTSGNVTNYGGLIGSLKDSGHMVKVEADVCVSGDFKGTNVGGLVGSMPSGVLYIANDENAPEGITVFPNLTLTKIKENASAARGWILGNRGNTLVFTDIPNWNQLPSKTSDDKESNDTGVWGQVLRVDQIDKNEKKLITLNSDHTVTVKAPASAYSQSPGGTTVVNVSNSVTISDVFDFAAVALRLQLNEVTKDESTIGALRFDGGDFNKASEVTITLSDEITTPINLNNTGLTGLTRDVNSTDVFNLTINGKGKTITLPDLKVYASSNAHDRQGLIGKAGKLTVSGLTVNGHIKTHVLNGDIYAGALLAEATGSFSLTSVTSNVAITVTGSGDGCAFSGFVGSTTKVCTSMEFEGCTFSGRITDSSENNKNNYIGGMLAYANNNETNDNTSFTVSANNCSISSAAITVSNAPSNYARVGGLFASLYWGKYELTISDLSVSSLHISVPEIQSGNISNDTINPKFCGGLLGCEWMKVEAIIENVTIQDSRLNAGAVPFGGLVYKSSGHWKVQTKTVTEGGKEVTKPGIHFSGTNSFSGDSPDDFPSGLLVSRGDNILNSNGTKRGALYLEIEDGAYKIDEGSVTVTVPDGKYFDEIVGITKGSYGNGIVSIGTAANSEGKRLIDQSGCNTYKPQLSTQYNNKKARYYYNLDTFRNQSEGNINTPEEMVVLSARMHCDSSLLTYFPIGNNIITGDSLDLTGYSYYPFPVDGRISVNSATITFDYKGLETAEATGANGSLNKKPSDSNRQHHEMHTGIFTDAIAGSSGLTLTVNGLTLKGTVGGSAIINGKAQGSGSQTMTQLRLTGITLDGIRTHPSPIALLVNKIESYTALTMTDVRVADPTDGKYPYDDLGDGYAAQSLIGNVGQTTDEGAQIGTYIQLLFSQMALDGRIKAQTGDDGKPIYYHNTQRTIFEEALFINDFQYSDGSTCYGKYDFDKIDTDKGMAYYTLGEELSNNGSIGRNPGEQYYFYNTKDFVYIAVEGSTEAGDEATAATYFLNDKYRRYVGNTESGSQHELDINLVSPDLTEGCGTLHDPYLIRNDRQLTALATLLQDGTNKNWTVKFNTVVLPPKTSATVADTFPNFSNLTAQNPHNGSQDVEFTCGGSTWTDANGRIISSACALAYLRNAYYKLVGPEDGEKVITLPETWAGLGKYSDDRAFSGVIMGGGATVHIVPGTPTQFGGLIKFSQGSVVKDVDIVYDTPLTITYAEVPKNYDAPFFGGVVGWCLRGDTIIENVTVTYNGNQPIIKGTNSHLVAVGGYVGLVGGYGSNEYGGGVVFKGTVSHGLSDGNFNDGTNYFYQNPYVGRVLDGYALGDGFAVENTNKNYKIPNISYTEGSTYGLSVNTTNNTITVSSAEGLWLLSAIANSGAGNLSGDKAYTMGRARTGDFAVDDAYLGGVENTSKSASYLTQYAANSSSLTGGTAWNIVLQNDCNMGNTEVYNYGNGFRGIGTSYSANGSTTRLIKVKELDGGGNTVTLAQNRKEYLDEKDNWTSIGTGLFVRLYQDSPSNPTIIKNLTLKGSTGITYYNGTSLDTYDSKGILYTSINNVDLYGSTRLTQVGAGMLASSIANVGTTDLTIENVTLDNVKVNSEGVGSVFAGGMIGVIWGGGGSKDNYLTVTLKDCTYTNPTVRGFVDAGGFIGRVRAKDSGKYAKIVITYSTNASLTGGDIATTSAEYNKYYSTVGGLVGCTYFYDLAIQPYSTTDAMMTISDLTVNSSYTGNVGDKVFGGGLVGLCYTPKTDCTIQNVTFTGKSSISGAESSNRRQLIGGLIGTLTHNFSWHNAGNASVNVSNVHIAESGSLKLQYTQQAGALFGILNISGKVQIQDIFIGSENNSPSVIIGNIKGDDSCNIGGLIGGGNALQDVTLQRIKMNNTYVLLNNNLNKDTRGAALLLGFLESSNGATDPKVNIRDITLKNSNIVRCDKKNRAGFVYGHLNKGNSNPPAINGSNILIENCNLGYATLTNSIDLDNFTLPTSLSTDGTAAGLIGGNCKDSLTSVQLVGVRVKGCTAPAQNFGTTNPKAGSYVIRADYSEAADSASKITTVPDSGISIMETGEASAKTLTSDGACFTGDDENPTRSIAEQIMRDYYSGIDCNSYFSIASAITTFASESEGVVTISDKLDTFHVAGEISDVDKKTISNFPVLVINSDAGNNTNSIVQNFITVLTNDTVAPRSISAATYEWSFNSETKEGVFTEASKASLSVSDSGTVSITPGGYDNQRNQFTLVDVTFDDPTTTEDSAYHLYIPVIVKKVMPFKFWASTQNGSSYNAGDYATLSQTTLASNKELVTSLLTFQYQWDASQWQIAVDTGTYLLWNFDKEISLYPLTSSPIPSGTRMTLVDRNNQYKTYYATFSGSETIKFSDFSDGNVTWTWNESTFLCDLLELKLESAENGKFALCTDSDQGKATLRIKTGDRFQYYRPAETDDTVTFDITVGLGDPGVKALAEETYFLTFQANETTSTGPYHFLIQCNPKLLVPSNLPEGKTGLPTVLSKKSINNSYATENENRVIINDFFTQAVTVSTKDSNQEMSSSEGSVNDTIKGTLTTTIKFPEDDEDKAYKLYDNQVIQVRKQTLKQQFCLFLKDQDGNPVDFVDGTTLTVGGKTIQVQGSSAALWLPVQNVTNWGTESGHPATVSVDFTLHYPTPESLMEQFPDKGDGSVGIQVWATSCLSMNEKALQRSNQRKTASDSDEKKLFYRTDVNLATMFYNAYDVDYPTQESGLSSLGINGWSTDNPPINSVALYNASALNKDGFQPKWLKCTVELLQKGQNGEYTTVVGPTDTAAPLMGYFSSIEVIPKVYVGSGYQVLPKNNNNKFIFALPAGVSWHENVQIDVNLAVHYGNDFENERHTYANYRVRLSAELLGDDLVRLPGTFAHDYIVYTNAKIRKELLS